MDTAIKKITQIISFGLFLWMLLFINYLRDMALSGVRSIDRSFNIAVATDGKTPVEVIADRIESVLPDDGVASMSIKRSKDIFEEYKKSPRFALALEENIFNDYILVYPGIISSKNQIEDLVLKIKNTAGVEDISYDTGAVEISLFIKDKLGRQLNFAIIFAVALALFIWVGYFYSLLIIMRKKNLSTAPPIFNLSNYLKYGYFLLVVSALVVIYISTLYRHSGIVFNWLPTGSFVFLALASAAFVFHIGENN